MGFLCLLSHYRRGSCVYFYTTGLTSLADCFLTVTCAKSKELWREKSTYCYQQFFIAKWQVNEKIEAAKLYAEISISKLLKIFPRWMKTVPKLWQYHEQKWLLFRGEPLWLLKYEPAREHICRFKLSNTYLFSLAHEYWFFTLEKKQWHPLWFYLNVPESCQFYASNKQQSWG